MGGVFCFDFFLEFKIVLFDCDEATKDSAFGLSMDTFSVVSSWVAGTSSVVVGGSS